MPLSSTARILHIVCIVACLVAWIIVRIEVRIVTHVVACIIAAWIVYNVVILVDIVLPFIVLFFSDLLLEEIFIPDVAVARLPPESTSITELGATKTF